MLLFTPSTRHLESSPSSSCWSFAGLDLAKKSIGWSASLLQTRCYRPHGRCRAVDDRCFDRYGFALPLRSWLESTDHIDLRQQIWKVPDALHSPKPRPGPVVMASDHISLVLKLKIDWEIRCSHLVDSHEEPSYTPIAQISPSDGAHQPYCQPHRHWRQ